MTIALSSGTGKLQAAEIIRCIFPNQISILCKSTGAENHLGGIELIKAVRRLDLYAGHCFAVCYQGEHFVFQANIYVKSFRHFLNVVYILALAASADLVEGRPKDGELGVRMPE